MWRFYKAYDLGDDRVRVELRDWEVVNGEVVYAMDTSVNPPVPVERRYVYRRRIHATPPQTLAQFRDMVKTEVRAHILRLRAEAAAIETDVSAPFDPGES
jgi:hypothetical protein